MKLLGLLAITCLSISATAETVNFDRVKPGSLPDNWLATQSGDGEAEWSVARDKTAPSKSNVLKQSGHARFPLCIKTDTEVVDGFVEVKFKPVSGNEDQAAGVVWRYQDPNNYYIARANALENNVVLYKVVNGKRSSLDIVGRKGGYGVESIVESGKWGTLRVNFADDVFTVLLNGKRLFAVEDDTFTTGGNVGVWTKADSVTLFDDFKYAEK